MELSPADEKIKNEAVAYIKSNKDALIETFVTSKKPLGVGFVTVFTAGSPGAGKTEFSRRYVPLFHEKEGSDIVGIFKTKGIAINEYETLIVRIDADEIREFIPQYVKTNHSAGTVGNAHVVQPAVNEGLDILRDYCLGNEISFLHDGTFGNYSTMRKVVKKSIADSRSVHIYYIYIDPLVAWDFTQKREYLEGRNIVKEKFIQQYLDSKINVDKIKGEFGDQVSINCILKDKNNEVVDVGFNQPSVDEYLKSYYSKGVIMAYSE